MSEQMHTQEPWHADAKGQIWRRHPSELYQNGGGVAGDHPLATVHRGYSYWEDGYPVEENARRIVACVNACAGWPTLFLEGVVIAGATLKQKSDEMSLRAHDAEQQRDKLLDALQGLLNALPAQLPIQQLKRLVKLLQKWRHPNDRTQSPSISALLGICSSDEL